MHPESLVIKRTVRKPFAPRQFHLELDDVDMAREAEAWRKDTSAPMVVEVGQGDAAGHPGDHHSSAAPSSTCGVPASDSCHIVS